jgi:hypothetical protein
MKPPTQIVTPTAAQYLDTIQHQINILRNVPPTYWQPQDISALHEVDDILDDMILYFEDMSDDAHRTYE